ncbi:2'-5' RNA ligase family protein [Rathayibacter sp. AY1G9]|uniref:2'-5' RNA ligase family protein n=1 Tax=Rathayibacter sp. AY1G9 TaxID=2080565 RepID=UPI0021583AA4|nr:2'-5' RNA ligase family protein [Rathayibacter sp. AY1G9]
MTRPFMTDPELLKSLRGQQYLVLRPVADVATFYDEEQAALQQRLPDGLSWPNTGHVTLRGFYEPDRVTLLCDALAAWAENQSPIDLQVVAVDGFPPPFQVLLARLERTPSLVTAYANLTGVLDPTDLYRIGELPLEEWVFHLSLIYARSLDEQQWQTAHAQTRRDLSPSPAELITCAEFVWYDEDGEHAKILPFATATS